VLTWRRHLRILYALVPVHVGVWTCLLHSSGGPAEPLFFLYSMEIVLSGATLGRLGSLLATVSAVFAYVGYVLVVDALVEATTFIGVLGFVAMSGVLTLLLIEVLDQQRRDLFAYQSTLAGDRGLMQSAPGAPSIAAQHSAQSSTAER
jgi:hypothetical protein